VEVGVDGADHGLALGLALLLGREAPCARAVHLDLEVRVAAAHLHPPAQQLERPLLHELLGGDDVDGDAEAARLAQLLHVEERVVLLCGVLVVDDK
jgi:hypothetical protein